MCILLHIGSLTTRFSFLHIQPIFASKYFAFLLGLHPTHNCGLFSEQHLQSTEE